MKKVLLIGDSISLYYRPFLFEMTRGVIDFEPNQIELDHVNREAAAQNTASSPSLYSIIIGTLGGLRKKILKMLFKNSKYHFEFSDYNMDDPERLNGGDSARVLEKLKDYQSRNFFGADLILLNCGLHDIKLDRKNNTHQVELDGYEKNLREIIQIMGRERLCWITTTPIKDGLHDKMDFNRLEADHRRYYTAAEKIMVEEKIPVIDLCAFTQNLTGDIYFDHVHFNLEIRKQQAAFVAGCLMVRVLDMNVI